MFHRPVRRSPAALAPVLRRGAPGRLPRCVPQGLRVAPSPTVAEGRGGWYGGYGCELLRLRRDDSGRVRL